PEVLALACLVLLLRVQPVLARLELANHVIPPRLTVVPAMDRASRMPVARQSAGADAPARDPAPMCSNLNKGGEADSARRGRNRPQAPLLDEGKRGTQSAPHDPDGSGATAGAGGTARGGTARTRGAP